MAFPTKIVTCCFCGTRAALVLKGAGSHELSCRSCGAPLHDLKMLPKQKTTSRAPAERVAKPAPNGYRPSRTPPKRKKRKRFLKKVFEEAFDLIEDIFD